WLSCGTVDRQAQRPPVAPFHRTRIQQAKCTLPRAWPLTGSSISHNTDGNSWPTYVPLEGKVMSSLRRLWQARVAISGAGNLVAGNAVAAAGASSAIAATSGVSASLGGGTTREISSSGTASFLPASSSQPGGIDNFEIAGPSDGALAPDRSHSSGGTPVGAITQ